MKSPARCLLLLCFAFAPPPAVAQQADDIVVTTHHIDAVRNARTPWDEVQNCLKDNACAGAIKLIAGQVGIPDNAVRLVETAAIYSAKAEGEETRYTVRAVSSRKICSVKVRTISVVPATGDRASLFSISPSADSVGIYTWTPRQGIGGGRSWYEGDVFIVHVKASLQEEYLKSGKCTVPPTGSINYQCRGASGVNKGLAACGAKDL
jgi:hypothetical protein